MRSWVNVGGRIYGAYPWERYDVSAYGNGDGTIDVRFTNLSSAFYVSRPNGRPTTNTEARLRIPGTTAHVVITLLEQALLLGPEHAGPVGAAEVDESRLAEEMLSQDEGKVIPFPQS